MPDRLPATIVTFAAPWGPLHGAATQRGIVAVTMFADPDAFSVEVARLPGISAVEPRSTSVGRAANRHTHDLGEQLAAYFAGTLRAFDVPLDLRVRSDWDRLVLDGVRRIPFGAAVSYGDVARQIGRVGAARAVGGALGRNPIAIVIPCHRVIAAGRQIGGYGGDWYGRREERLWIKRDLLRREGVLLDDEPTTVQIA